MKGKKFFYLFKRKKYYIYGYTKRAVLVAELLRREKYNFCGYIDRDAEHLKKEYHVEAYTIDGKNIDKESIIYISCYSIDTQHKIAKMLSERGYNNLIFMAAGNIFPDKYATTVRRAWETYDFDQIPHEIMLPKYRQNHTESDVIEKRGKEIVVWIPVELLCSIPEERDKGDPKKWEMIPKDIGIPLVTIKRQVQFFECIINHSGTCNEYVDSYSKQYNVDANAKLKERRKILKIWDQELARGIGYFCDAAVVFFSSYSLLCFLYEGMSNAAFAIRSTFLLVFLLLSNGYFLLSNHYFLLSNSYLLCLAVDFHHVYAGRQRQELCSAHVFVHDARSAHGINPDA